MKKSELTVIGAGASGIMAALTAAMQGKKVTLIERQARVGRKLMATGNGRCNITNIKADLPFYHGDNVGFAEYALCSMPVQKTIEFFSSIGLLTTVEEGGRVYPLSNSANSVVDTLRYALEATGVEIVNSCLIKTAKKHGDVFRIYSDEPVIECNKLIIACGGAAGEKLGGSQDGYKILKSFGHSSTAIAPALSQIKTKPDFPRSLKGVKADVRTRIEENGNTIATSEGEALFTETGVSGPAIFDISRTAAVNSNKNLELRLNFFRNRTEADLYDYINNKKQKMPNLSASEVWTGALHNRLGRMLIKYSGIDSNKIVSELSQDEMSKIVRNSLDFVLPIYGTDSFSQAQVTAGGIRCSEFCDKTMQSKIVKGLYACGEVLDIDGDCGGFNLQWAWSSGYLAGLTLD